MKNKRIFTAFGQVDEKYIEEAAPGNRVRKIQKRSFAKWGALAACVALIALSITALPHFNDSNSVPLIQKISSASDAPDRMRKYMNYDKHRYAFLENGSTYQFSSEQLVAVLGTLEHDIQKDPQTNGKKDFAATFALGGTIYQISSYDPAFRLVVELDGNYYICENVDATDGTDIDVSAYFESAGFAQNVEQIIINDHAGKNALKTLTGKDVSRLVELLSMVTPAELTNEEYEKIGKAQKSGESYLLSFQLKDTTAYKMYIIPKLSLAMIGDNRYILPGEFATEFDPLFEELKQQPMPMQ